MSTTLSSNNHETKLRDDNTLPAEQEISGEVLLEKYAKGNEQNVHDVRQPRGARPGRGRGRRQANPLGKTLPRSAGERLRAGRPHQFRRRHRPAGHADQLLRAAGRRFHLRGRRRPSRHLHRPVAGSRDDAPRRRRRLRLLLDPPGRRLRQGHAFARLGPGVLHARLRPLLRDGGIRRRAPRRPDGRAALRPPGHRDVHPRQGQGRPHQLQHLHRRHRRLHAGGRARRRRRTGAQVRALRRHHGGRRLPARGRQLGLPQGARARVVGADHALDLRPRRAGHPLPRPHQPRQQPQLLRDHRGHQPLRRAAAAALRLLLPGLDQPDALRHARVHAEGRIRLRRLRPRRRAVHAHARQRARRHALAAAAAAGRGRRQAPHRAGLHRPGRRADHARPALRHGGGARQGHRDLGLHARPRLPRLRRTGQASAAPSRSSTPTCTCPAATSPPGCPRRSRSRSASTASATRTCSRSRRPGRFPWPSPTTPPTASSRPSRGPTRARSA